MTDGVNFRTKVLRRETRPGEFRIYCAALEWDLTDPILIESREDLKSERRWGDRLTPYHHQVDNLITFCRRLPVTLLADDVGLGKTISAGLVISELVARGRLSGILVVCPKLLGPQWKEELESKFDIPAVVANGRELLDIEPETPGAVITTYNSARLHLDRLPPDRFQMLILDEAHKLRNLHGVPKPPQVALAFQSALEERRFRFVLMLTATPIQNRLWDLYSLVSLLTVARGHQNPFGSPEMFARKFIDDKPTEARVLKPGAKEEFRSIVYGYMSRMRRGDANLFFPDRTVQMHHVSPTREEQELIAIVGESIDSMNRLAQISVLQALTSSPQALSAQLKNMARNGTVRASFAEAVEFVVGRMPRSAKLIGLAELIAQLKREKPDRWRLVVFTGRRETQTTIVEFLEAQGLKVGVINGSTGARNQDTLRAFRSTPPGIHVIVSTEAGSEGVNLQVANILVNYDLPWNPMIVEQRIGRVQRLASEHASVGIFNITLRGTFEEYIVGRLMEKLQMASHAIGDIEALLDASGVGDADDGKDGFEERIRQLVMAALAGKDTELATRQAEESIARAKIELETEAATINDTLGRMDGAAYTGPRMPSLPMSERSMPPEAFVVAALEILGAEVVRRDGGCFVRESGRTRLIVFDTEDASPRVTVYAPGTPAFDSLVDRVVATGVHDVGDADPDIEAVCGKIARRWLDGFGATPKGIVTSTARRRFDGKVGVRVRATVAHDSYERLVSVLCRAPDHRSAPHANAVRPVGSVLEDLGEIGVDIERVRTTAQSDPAIQEFRRFYIERRTLEMQSAGNDERRRKRLEDDFTPLLEMTVVAANGRVSREVEMVLRYRMANDEAHEHRLVIIPSEERIVGEPEMGTCSVSGCRAPLDCMRRCEVSRGNVLRHLLVRSEVSGRYARPEHAVRCEASGQTVLRDEVTRSDVTGRMVATDLLQTSVVSGKRAEAEHCGACEFTKGNVLLDEFVESEVSGKKFRNDQKAASVLSGKTGHSSEFVACGVTGKLLLPLEGERCEVTGAIVLPGLLEPCAVTGKHVLPGELERCAATGRRALRSLLVSSSLSEARLLESEAVRSASGSCCLPAESQPCAWSHEPCHPADLRVCHLTGLAIKYVYVSQEAEPRLLPLVGLLDGAQRNAESREVWEEVGRAAVAAVGRGRSGVQAATLSPDGQSLAVCFELWTMLGLRAQTGGLVYDLQAGSVMGRVVLGKRKGGSWVARVDR